MNIWSAVRGTNVEETLLHEGLGAPCLSITPGRARLHHATIHQSAPRHSDPSLDGRR
jgi:hypothetical protein